MEFKQLLEKINNELTKKDVDIRYDDKDSSFNLWFNYYKLKLMENFYKKSDYYSSIELNKNNIDDENIEYIPTYILKLYNKVGTNLIFYLEFEQNDQFYFNIIEILSKMQNIHADNNIKSLQEILND